MTLDLIENEHGSKSAHQGLAIVHDYLTQRGGAERVVLAMHRAFPEAPIYTSLFRPETTFPEFQEADVRPLFLNRIAPLRVHHRVALPVLAVAFSNLHVAADVVLCSSSGWAHGAHARGRKVVYCHTPARWLYQSERYVAGRQPSRLLLRTLRPWLLRWDRKAALSANRYLTQSSTVRERIKQVYGIQAQLVPAPYALQEGGDIDAAAGIRPGFFLCVARLLAYKNLEHVIEAFRNVPNERLVLAGDGPLKRRLSSGLPPNVTMVGAVDDTRLRWLYRHCRGVIAAAYEDYGLVPLEAAAFGKPAAVLRWGGFLDTVIENQTGVFFDAPTALLIEESISRLRASRFEPTVIRQHAEAYSESRFVKRLRDIVSSELRTVQ